MTPPDRPAHFKGTTLDPDCQPKATPPAPDLDARMERWQAWTERDAWPFNDLAHARDAITTLRAQLAEAENGWHDERERAQDLEQRVGQLIDRVAALEAALMAIRGKASELVEFYASGVSKEIANLADAALKGAAT